MFALDVCLKRKPIWGLEELLLEGGHLPFPLPEFFSFSISNLRFAFAFTFSSGFVAKILSAGL